MAVILPPTPVGLPPDHSFWNDWYEKLRTVVNTGAISITWGNINFTGSSLSSLASRPHSDLQSIQGGGSGEYYHLTAAQHAALSSGAHNSLASIQGGSALERYHLTNEQHSRATTVISLAANPTAANIATQQWAIYKNTTTGQVRLWANDGGTLKSVLLT